MLVDAGSSYSASSSSWPRRRAASLRSRVRKGATTSFQLPRTTRTMKIVPSRYETCSRQYGAQSKRRVFQGCLAPMPRVRGPWAMAT